MAGLSFWLNPWTNTLDFLIRKYTSYHETDKLSSVSDALTLEGQIHEVDGLKVSPRSGTRNMPIFASLEWYLDVANTVRALYLRELLREPEPEGLYNWLFHAREEGKDADWILAQIQASPEWHQIHDTPPFKAAPRFWRGNMCGIHVAGLPVVDGGAGDPTLVLSWFYDRYNTSDRAAIRAAMKAKGYTHWLLSWPDSRAAGASPEPFLATCRELIADGFYPCVMLSSKVYDPSNTAGVLANIEPVLGLLVGVVPMLCVGWELSLWLTPAVVQELIDALHPQWLKQPDTLGYVHFQEGYAAFQQNGGTTADFWKLNVGKLHGILHQRDLSWDKPMYQARLVDVLQRCAGGFNWPADSGFGHPFDCVALEITASPQFNGQMSEAEGNSWGGVAIATPAQNGPFGPVSVMGSGNGS